MKVYLLEFVSADGISTLPLEIMYYKDSAKKSAEEFEGGTIEWKSQGRLTDSGIAGCGRGYLITKMELK